MPPPFSRSVRFASFLCYSPRGTSEVSRTSRTAVRDPVKRGLDSFLAKAAHALRSTIQLEDWFGPQVTLVPAPRSAPLLAGGLWPSDRICAHLVSHDLARGSLRLLTRTKPVAKAAYSPGNRPSYRDHQNSIRIDFDLDIGDRILVVDDIVTRGDTLFACVTMLEDAYSEVEVRGFALVRTMGLIPEVEKIIDPTEGTITGAPFGGVVRVP